MRDLLLFIAFVLIMAYLQAKSSKKILRYNSKLTSTQTEKKDNGIYMIITLIIMMALAMFRGRSVGSDTDEYHRIFINIITNPDYANVTRYETGYIFLNKLVGKFTSNSQGIIIVTSFIYYSIFIWFIKKHSKNYALSIIIFYFFIFGASLTMIRQELAMAFLLIAYDRVLNKKTISAYFWIVIAFLFHSSAIIFAVMPILPYIKFNNFLAIFLTIIVIILTATNLLFRIFNIIAPQYSHYFGGHYVGTGALAITYQFLRNAVFFILIYLVIYKIKDNRVCGISRLNCGLQNNFVLWLIFISAVGLIFGYRINLIDRIITYFNTFYIIFIPNVLKKYDKNSKKVLTFLIVLIMTAYMIVAQIFRPEWNTIYPYQFFWQ